MTTIQATVQDGQFVPREPVDWPEGSEVEVTLRQPADADIHGDSPESIARWFTLWESTPSPTMTEEEWAEWHRHRREYREWELAHAEERAKKLAELWK